MTDDGIKEAIMRNHIPTGGVITNIVEAVGTPGALKDYLLWGQYVPGLIHQFRSVCADELPHLAINVLPQPPDDTNTLSLEIVSKDAAMELSLYKVASQLQRCTLYNILVPSNVCWRVETGEGALPCPKALIVTFSLASACKRGRYAASTDMQGYVDRHINRSATE